MRGDNQQLRAPSLGARAHTSSPPLLVYHLSSAANRNDKSTSARQCAHQWHHGQRLQRRMSRRRAASELIAATTCHRSRKSYRSCGTPPVERAAPHIYIHNIAISRSYIFLSPSCVCMYMCMVHKRGRVGCIHTRLVDRFDV